MSVVRVGSRKSELALVQTNKVIDLLKFHYPEKIFEVVTYDTLGDKFNSLPLPKIGEKSLFTKELELALQRREVDLVVHSLKDLPSSLPKNLRIGAICKRDDPHDCVLYHPKFGSNVTPTSLNSLPNNSTVGSSSIRRISQLKQLYPQLIFLDIRGNVNTRLKKLCECDKYDAIILAKAGVDRMGWQDRIGQILNGDEFFYAVGQGALAVEIRSDDDATGGLVSIINDRETELCCLAERALMLHLQGGCSTPIGVKWHSQGRQSAVLEAACFSVEDNQRVTYRATVAMHTREDAEKLGQYIAQKMLEAGADTLLRAARGILATGGQNMQ